MGSIERVSGRNYDPTHWCYYARRSLIMATVPASSRPLKSRCIVFVQSLSRCECGVRGTLEEATITLYMSERRLLQLILIATFLLGAIYAIVNPVFEGGDELWHYPMVQHLANGNPLPVQVFDPNEAGLWKQQASQPPLYYYAAAALTFWIDTSDMVEKRWENPHVDNGIVTQDGNINLTIHNPNWNAWQGTLLAVRIVRFFSVLLGVITVYFTYRIAKYVPVQSVGVGQKLDERFSADSVITRNRIVALLAAAMVAFVPMRLFVGAAVNNDNGMMALATVAVFLIVRLVERASRPSESKSPRNNGIGNSSVYADATLIGLVIGAACLTKIVGVGLLPLALGGIFIANWQRAPRQPFALRLYLQTAVQFLYVFAVAFVVAGWWYIRNVQLYDDWRGWSAFIAVLGERPQPATLAQLWDERVGFMQSYWGLFGGVNVPMANWIYTVLNGMLIVGLIGFALYAVRQVTHFARANNSVNSSATDGIVAKAMRRLFDFAAANFAIVCCLVWFGAVVYGLIDWATTTWSSQGRLVFGALQVEMVLLATGLIGLVGQRVGKWTALGVGGFMFTIALLSPFLYIFPAYRQPQPTVAQEVLPDAVTFGDSIRLNWHTTNLEARPGEPFELVVDWEVLQPLPENYSTFIHLTDPVLNTPIAQRDRYLGQGLVATSFAEVGVYTEKYVIEVPRTAFAPSVLDVNVGLYDVATEMRLLTDAGAEYITLYELNVLEDGRTFPNQTEISFEEGFRLVGYELSERRLQAGETLDVTLYFYGETAVDYSLTAQILSEDVVETTRFGAMDVGTGSSSWSADNVQEIQLSVPISAESPPNVYRLVIGLYTQLEDGSFRNLSLMQDGRITNDSLLTLTKVRIDE